MSAFRFRAALFVALVAFSTSSVLGPLRFVASAHAQEAEATAPSRTSDSLCSEAEGDAKRHHDVTGYFIGGFFCGVIGFAVAVSSTPSVPADRLVGKSPEQAGVYSRCYQDAAKRKVTGAACSGWAIGASVALSLVALSAAGSSSP